MILLSQFEITSLFNLNFINFDIQLVFAYTGNMFDSFFMFNQAEECFHKYMQLLENNLGGECATVSNGYFTLGNYYFRRGKIKKASMCYNQSKEIRSGLAQKCEESISHCKINMALCLFEQNKIQECQNLLKEIETDIKSYKGKENQLIAQVYQIMCHVCQKVDKFDEADMYLRRATAIVHKLYGDKVNSTTKLSEFMNKDIDLNLTKKYLEMFKMSYKEFERIKKSTATRTLDGKL